MAQKIRIVFRWEIIAGEAEAVVRECAAQLLKASPEQIERIFSGKSIVLCKELPEEDGLRYQTHLEKTGMRVYVEKIEEETVPPMPAPPPSQAHPVDPVVLAPAPMPGSIPAPAEQPATSDVKPVVPNKAARLTLMNYLGFSRRIKRRRFAPRRMTAWVV